MTYRFNRPLILTLTISFTLWSGESILFVWTKFCNMQKTYRQNTNWAVITQSLISFDVSGQLRGYQLYCWQISESLANVACHELLIGYQICANDFIFCCFIKLAARHSLCDLYITSIAGLIKLHFTLMNNWSQSRSFRSISPRKLGWKTHEPFAKIKEYQVLTKGKVALIYSTSVCHTLSISCQFVKFTWIW